MVTYIVVAFILDCIYRRFDKQRAEVSLKPADWLFNGATFSGSVTIGMGIVDHDVFILIGDTGLYLTLAGIAGLGYSLLALRPKK